MDADRHPEFSIGLRRQSRCRLGVPCVMRDCQMGLPPEQDVHFFAPDGNIYPTSATVYFGRTVTDDA